MANGTITSVRINTGLFELAGMHNLNLSECLSEMIKIKTSFDVGSIEKMKELSRSKFAIKVSEIKGQYDNAKFAMEKQIEIYDKIIEDIKNNKKSDENSKNRLEIIIKPILWKLFDRSDKYKQSKEYTDEGWIKMFIEGTDIKVSEIDAVYENKALLREWIKEYEYQMQSNEKQTSENEDNDTPVASKEGETKPKISNFEDPMDYV